MYIKREDAIKAIKQWLDNDGSLFDVGLNQAIREIKRLPSADRPQEWIPCRERLPEEDVAVLVTTREKYRLPKWTESKTYKMVSIASWDGEDGWSTKRVLAWMPLPEPWKGADDE